MIFYLGVILVFYATIFTVAAPVGLIYDETVPLVWYLSTGCCLVSGLACMASRKRSIDVRGSIILILFSWLILSLVSAFPMWLDQQCALNFWQAWFESTSGLTTTGLSIVPRIKAWPHYLQFYHQLLQYLGGMGVLLIVMTILPMVGSGAFDLFRSQVQSSSQQMKLLPRFREVAQWLMICYLAISVVSLIAFVSIGMPLFDAVCWMFATVSTGGFVIHDYWLRYPSCQLVSIAVMFVAATSFNLHFLALKQSSLRVYYRDAEWRWWVKAIVLATIIVWISYDLNDTKMPFYHILFQIVSIVSSTGYMVPDEWIANKHLLSLVIVLGYIGGCSGSTSSGVKWGRIYLIKNLIMDAYAYLLHPSLVLGRRENPQLISLILTYVVLLFVTVSIVSFLLILSGMHGSSAFDITWAATTNLGATITDDVSECSPYQLFLLTSAMLIGRVECVTFYMIFLKRFWRR